MMNFEPLGEASEQNVAAFEQQIGFGLPPDYRRFLVENNGAEVFDQTFFVKDLDKEVMLDVLFGVTNPTSRGLTLGYWLKEYEDELESGTLIIGKDPGGSFLIYTIAGEDKGLYYWDKNYLFAQSSELEGNAYFVADSFTEFRDSLRDYTLA
ncbi:MAG TPA: SMI1/KNR4 family protein [Hymenobacter sp.]|nr:SMI1/KNR4 family protein [Hymenobacter sp.]